MKPKICNLQSCFFCTHSSPVLKDLIAIHKETLRIKKGAPVFKEGQPWKGLYLLYEGAAKVHKPWAEGKELIIRFSQKGDILGHRGFTVSEHYPVSATALTDVLVCFFPAEFLDRLLSIDHGLTLQLLKWYASELQLAEDRMRRLALGNIPGRIAEMLISLKEKFGTDKSGYIGLSISRQDMAAYAGTTYETVFRVLKQMQASKYIVLSNKLIKIAREARLREMAGE